MLAFLSRAIRSLSIIKSVILLDSVKCAALNVINAVIDPSITDRVIDPLHCSALG